MGGYCIWCFALAILVSTPPQLAFAGRVGLPGPRGRKGAPRLRPVPYCKVNSEITSFLRQLDRKPIQKGDVGIPGERGKIGLPRFRVSGRSGREKRHGESNKWLYNCLYAGLNVDEGVFEMPVYKCCTKCEFPRFPQCIRKYMRKAAHSRCNSKAIRCIAGCLGRKQLPVKHRKLNTGQPGKPGKCPVKKRYIGGSYCLERSCIPV